MSRSVIWRRRVAALAAVAACLRPRGWRWAPARARTAARAMPPRRVAPRLRRAPPSCRAAGDGCSPTGGSWASTATRATRSSALGIGTPAHASRRLLQQAKPYGRRTRPVLPAMELISSVATAAPGPDGLYRDQLGDAAIRRYLHAARRIHGLLMLDIQPGRAAFGPEVERLAWWLREPDVGLALDPEWHVDAGGVPGKVIGSTTAETINAAAAYLSHIVKKYNLPKKLLLVHRFTFDMIAGDDRIRSFRGVATTIDADGFGGQAVKVGKYHAFVDRTPRLGRSFKLFYKEDVDTMTPAEVMRMQPRPDVVVYE